jgi:hypothetical protein
MKVPTEFSTGVTLVTVQNETDKQIPMLNFAIDPNIWQWIISKKHQPNHN